MNSTYNNTLRAMPPVVKHLLIINVLMWVATMVFQNMNIDLTNVLGLHFWQAADFKIWQFVTYMFMHDSSSVSSGFSHLFFNMFSLWMFGRMLERAMGSKRFLTYYLVCGLGAALVQEFTWQLTWQSTIGQMLQDANGQRVILDAQQVGRAIASGQLPPAIVNQCLNAMVTVGASGAVFGILLAFAWFFPNVPLYLFFIPMPIKAKWMVLIYGAIELLFGVQGIMGNVAHFAHLGGLLFGLLLLLYWRSRRILIRKNDFY